MFHVKHQFMYLEDETKMADLNLYFPQWQGAGERKTLYLGAAAARKGLNLKNRLQEVKLHPGDKLEKENGIIGYRPIVEQLKNVRSILDAQEMELGSIFTLGGGCDVELAPISYLNRAYKGELSVLWFDAHGDLNSPETSPSGHFHGMPLRVLLEDGIEELDQLCYSKLKPEQVSLMGVRELDPGEQEFIEKHKMNHMPPEKIIWGDPNAWMDRLAENVYVHIDLDVLDKEAFPHTLCPVNHGLQMEQLMGIMKMLEEKRRIVGISLLEYAHLQPEPMEAFKTLAAIALWI